MINHVISRITAFTIVSDYTLQIQFDGGLRRIVNFRPILAGELFGPLRDLELFNQVQIGPEVHTLIWPNGADFDPETLHDWPRYEQAFREMAARWEPVKT